MALEIERKFRVKDASWRPYVDQTLTIHQGYLNHQDAIAQGDEQVSIRVRIQDALAFLSLKTCEPGHTRQEFEYPIPFNDGQALLALCVGRSIQKYRHLVHHQRHRWEIDEFLAENSGLVIAEVELQDPHEAIDLPPWLAQEVTDDARYYNLQLAVHPFHRWDSSLSSGRSGRGESDPPA